MQLWKNLVWVLVGLCLVIGGVQAAACEQAPGHHDRDQFVGDTGWYSSNESPVLINPAFESAEYQRVQAEKAIGIDWVATWYYRSLSFPGHGSDIPSRADHKPRAAFLGAGLSGK